MQKLLSQIEEIQLANFQCYRSFDYDKNSLTIKNSNESYSSYVESKELVQLYNIFKKRDDLIVNVLKNGDLFIQQRKNK